MAYLSQDINRIRFTKNPYINSNYYDVIVHTTEKDIYIDQVINVEIMRDYVGNITDFVTAVFNMYMGDYIYDLYPHRDHLEITLKYRNNREIIDYGRYKFILTNNQGNIDGSIYGKLPKAELNKSQLMRVEGQALIREVEVIRNSFVQGVYTNATLDNVIPSIVKTEASKSSVEGRKIDLNVILTPPNNDNEYKHIIIPSGTKLLSLPNYLQNGQYGLYNGMVGSYIQKYNSKLSMFIYPLYDSSQFNKASHKLKIYKTDNIRMDNIENTWMIENNIVSIIAGDNTSIQDNGENTFMDRGSGIIYNDPVQMTYDDNDLSDSDIKVDQASHTVGSKFSSRRDGIDKPIYIGNESNRYKHRSIINKDSMMVMQVTWRFCLPNLLYPGMPVCYTYEDDRESYPIVKCYGVLLGAAYVFSAPDKTMSALLNIAVEKPLIKRYKG